MKNELYFDVKPGKSCLYASLVNLLAYYGYKVTEAELFFLCRGMSFNLSHLNLNEIAMPSQYFQYRSATHITNNVADDLNIHFISGKSLLESQSYQHVEVEANRQNPILVLLSPHVLKYVPRDFNPDAEYELHCILLYSINDVKNLSYIADSYVVDNSGRVSTYTGQFPNDVLKNQVKEFIYIKSYNKTIISQEKMLSIVLKNISDFVKSKQETNNLTGWRAISHCINQAAIISSDDIEYLKRYLLELSYLLKAHFIILFDYLLDYLFHSIYKDELSEKIIQLNQLRSGWSNYCMKIWKRSFNPIFYTNSKMLETGDLLMEQTGLFLEEINNYLSDVNKNN